MSNDVYIKDDFAENMGVLIIKVSVSVLPKFKRICNSKFTDKDEVKFFLEHSIILVSIVNKIIENKISESKKNRVINKILEKVKISFGNQSHYGIIKYQRKRFYQKKYDKRNKIYSGCNYVAGQGSFTGNKAKKPQDIENTIIYRGASIIVDDFWGNLKNKEKNMKIVEVSNFLAETIYALLVTETMSQITK